MSEPTTPPGATDGHPGRDSVPSQVMTRGELGAALTTARTAAGLSIREVVRRVPGLSLGTASGWFSGQHVPTAASRETFGALLTVIGVHDDEVDQWHRAAARARALPGPRRGRR
ncbi:MAG TPA: helix-turn-helix transcriptional regulator, partial [Actinomycetales bacterium]|nr:helix-turn-helix transcriptional regulator [Actinomycetales bacterium]